MLEAIYEHAPKLSNLRESLVLSNVSSSNLMQGGTNLENFLDYLYNDKDKHEVFTKIDERFHEITEKYRIEIMYDENNLVTSPLTTSLD